MIVLESMVIKGFGSIVDPFTMKFKPSGLIVIRGDNGAGKTTFFSALFWCWYGKTLKGNDPCSWEWTNPKNTGTEVITNLKRDGIKYQIIRTSNGKKNTIKIMKKGIQVPLKGIKDHQDYIEKIIGQSMSLFKHSLLFGQKMKRIMEEDGTAQKRLLEEAFGINFIERAKQQAEQRKLAYLSQFKDVETSIIATRENNVQLRGMIKTSRLQKENFQSTKDARIKDVNKLMSMARLRISNNKDKVEALVKSMPKKDDKLMEEIHTLRADISRFEDELTAVTKYSMKLSMLVDDGVERIAELTRILDKLEGDKPTCKFCGSFLSVKGTIKHLSETHMEINTLSEQVATSRKILVKQALKKKQLSSSITNSKQDLTNISNSLISTRSNEVILENIKGDMATQKTALSQLKRELTSLENSVHISDLPKLILKLRKNSKELTLLKPKYRKLQQELELLTWALKIPLSNSGLKTYLFDSLLSDLNNRMSKYSSFIGFTPYFSIKENARRDLELNIIRNGNEISALDPSGGQGQLISVVIALGVNDIVSSISNINLMLLDEIFESLDSRNMEIITDIITTKSNERLVMLVTHREEFIPENSQIMRFRLVNEKTRISLS